MFRSLFLGYDDHGYGGYDDWGPNRSGWAEKSDAASRREHQANSQFDDFLKRCSALDANDKSFPITEEVVQANVHLTGACWSSFRKRVVGKGCKVKRREATHAERKASGDTRKGKLYVISITCPVHPNKASEAKAKATAAAAAKKKKAEETAQRKAEKERKDREERERLAALHREKVREKYASIVGKGCDDAGEDGDMKRKQSPGKSAGTMDAFVKVKVTSEDLLNHAKTVHNKRTDEVRASIRKEEAEVMAELRKKHAQEEKELRSKMSKKMNQLLDEAAKNFVGVETKIANAY